MNHFVGDLPRHHYCFVDSQFTHQVSKGFVPCVWFAVVSYPGRVWGCTVMLECGAVYRNVPAHALAFSPRPDLAWKSEDAQTWDCYGDQFSAIEYKYLSGLDCKVKANKREHEGEYLFTAAPYGDGFSAYPEQAKEFCFVKLDNDRLTIQPTNLIVFRERSFTEPHLQFPQGLKAQAKTYSCE